MHRDIKPANILVTDDDFAYLVDFGIARAASDPGLTQTGMAMGTYDYMAPERFTGDDVTYLADVYSLACVLTECLTGSAPYQAHSVEQAVAAHLTTPPPRPSEIRPGRVPMAFDEVIARGMAKNPGDRYRSAGDLAIAAREALSEPDRNVVTRILRSGEATSPPTDMAQTMASPTLSPTPQPGWGSTSATGQSMLPFNGLDFRLSPSGVALDGDDNVYITSQGMYGRVVKLAPGSSKPTVLPFNGLYQPQSLAVDSAGAVYVSDFNNRVVKLAAGSNSQTVLPFNGLNYPEGVAVDSGGNVYVADRGNDRVLKLTAGSTNQTVLPFDGLDHPDGVAVDSAGNVYVTDTDNNRVLKLSAGSSAQTVLPFTGVSVPCGIAVDNGGNVYVTEHDSNKVLRLTAGSVTPAALSFTGLNTPLDVAVDKHGNTYIADRGNDRVVKLASRS